MSFRQVLFAIALLLTGLRWAAAQPAFPQGVAAGDVTSAGAICWTRAAAAGQIVFELATDDLFQSIVATAALTASPSQDQIVKLAQNSLSPGTRYYYRFRRSDDGRTSPVGTFVTAPPDDEARAFRFVYSGDSSALSKPFHLLGHAAAEQPHFWVWAGDTVYTDMPAPGEAVATDLPGYRSKYAQNRDDAFLQSLSAASPVWAQWDDHEVANDYDGGDLEPGITRQRQIDAYQAFFEWMPIRPPGDAADPWRIYRSFRYGSLAEFFILDCRQYRSKDVAREGGGFDPRGFFLPGFEPWTIWRMQDPSRTMLGRAQLEWLKQGLSQSTATWKFVLSSVPFTSLLVYPQDRWDGYDAERYDVLRHIDAAGIRGVVILSADIHGNIHNPDVTYFLRNRLWQPFSPGFAVPEYVAGPIATSTTRQEIEEVAGAVFDSTAEEIDACTLFNLGMGVVQSRIEQENRLAFVDFNRYAYLMVDVTPEGLTFTFRGVPPDPHAANSTIETLYTTPLSNPTGTQPLPCFLFPLAVFAFGVTVAGLARRRLVMRRT